MHNAPEEINASNASVLIINVIATQTLLTLILNVPQVINVSIVSASTLDVTAIQSRTIPTSVGGETPALIVSAF